jgi:hypothetical protein
VTDYELEVLALAADADAPLDPDAVPIDQYLMTVAPATLPDWYMTPPSARRRRGWSRVVILGFIASLIFIEAYGLCSTYGQIPFH